MTATRIPTRLTASGPHLALWLIAGLVALAPTAADDAAAQQYRQLREPGQVASREAEEDGEGESLESPTRAAGTERSLRMPGSRTSLRPGSSDGSSSEGDSEEQGTTDLGRIDTRISSRVDNRVATRLSTRIETRIGARSRSETQDGTAEIASDTRDAPSDAAPEG